MMRARRTAFGLACVAASAACVPRGDPPAGRQLVVDRVTSIAGFARPNGDGITRVLLMRRPAQTPGQAIDLYVAAVDATGAPTVEHLLATNVAPMNDDGCFAGVGGCPFLDARGRILVTAGSDVPVSVPTLARIDPITGARQEIGMTPYSFFSPSRERLVAIAALPATGATLYENDDRVLVLVDATSPAFVGEDLYYATPQGELERIVPGGAPELLATGITSFSPALDPAAALITLTRPTADPSVSAVSFLDTVTLQETAAPTDFSRFDLSPDGRWLLAIDVAAQRGTFIERTTGISDSFDLPSDLAGRYEWRPGHDEIWFSSGSYSQPTTTIEKPGAPPVAIPGLAVGLLDSIVNGSSMFTRDGAYWFSSRAAPDQATPIIQVGSADDPMGARFDLVPIGTYVGEYRRLADGRLLTTAQLHDWDRSDIYAIDPATGASSALGEAGFVMAVGQTRALANLHVNSGRGDLTVIDLASGRPTVLAPEFTLGAAVEPQGEDRAAPGTHVAYQFQARFDSPYDGIWLVTLP